MDVMSGVNESKSAVTALIDLLKSPSSRTLSKCPQCRLKLYAALKASQAAEYYYPRVTLDADKAATVVHLLPPKNLSP